MHVTYYPIAFPFHRAMPLEVKNHSDTLLETCNPVQRRLTEPLVFCRRSFVIPFFFADERDKFASEGTHGLGDGQLIDSWPIMSAGLLCVIVCARDEVGLVGVPICKPPTRVFVQDGEGITTRPILRWPSYSGGIL
jgi:hypothetical protein